MCSGIPSARLTFTISGTCVSPTRPLILCSCLVRSLLDLTVFGLERAVRLCPPETRSPSLRENILNPWRRGCSRSRLLRVGWNKVIVSSPSKTMYELCVPLIRDKRRGGLLFKAQKAPSPVVSSRIQSLRTTYFAFGTRGSMVKLESEWICICTCLE